jgi:DNA-binding MarR family transcriptional regulator
VLPKGEPRGQPQIDYLGAGLIAAGLSAIVLVTSLGGNTWAWDSAQLLITAAAGVGLLILFAFVERRAPEPVLPLRLFRNRVFSVAGGVGLIVGFALFGAITFLPLFFQTVNGASPTGSGLRLIPLIAGLLVTSIGSGQVISRIGRYRPFPIMGTALITVGFVLLSRMDTGTSTLSASLRLLLLGLGLGLVMQVLVLAVQNAVDYRDLGVATSGATTFRSIGGALGTAVFGAVFTNRLADELAGSLPAAVHQSGRLSPEQLAKLPPAAHDAYTHAFVNALQPVFLTAAGVAAVGFLLTLALPDRKLRDTVEASGPQDHFAVPRADDSSAEIERALSVLARRDTRRRFYERLFAELGIELSPLEGWTLARVEERIPGPAENLGARLDVDPSRISSALTVLEERQLIVPADGWYAATPEGTEIVARVVEARRARLQERLADWSPEEHEELAHVLDRLARDLLVEPPRERALAKDQEAP